MHPYLAGRPPIAMAHRGAHDRGAGENSFEAFERAVSLGYRYLETDVHRTADGVLVAMHDPTLERTTDGEGPVAPRAWGEIARLRVAGGGRVPRLEELLGSWPDVRWNIDCKAVDAVAPLLATLTRADALDRACVGSFEGEAVEWLRRHAGAAVCTAATRREVRRLVVAARLPRPTRLLARARLPCDAAQVPVVEGRTTVVTEAFVETCHDAGIAVHVWTVDEPDEMRRLLALGVDGLITDAPTALRDVLAERGAWPPSDRTGGASPGEVTPGVVP